MRKNTAKKGSLIQFGIFCEPFMAMEATAMQNKKGKPTKKSIEYEEVTCEFVLSRISLFE